MPDLVRTKGLYRFGVPDEDLGASVGVLLRRNLQVAHQHLHAFPVGESPKRSRHTETNNKSREVPSG